MATRFNTQVGNGEYRLQFETDNKDHYLLMQKMARQCVDAESVDVESVMHGRWAHLGGDEWCCTECGIVITTEGSWVKPTQKFCNECGAKMDMEEGDQNE